MVATDPLAGYYEARAAEYDAVYLKPERQHDLRAIERWLDGRFVAGSSTPIAATDAAGDTWQPRRLRDGSVHRVLKNFPDENALHDAIAATGGGGRLVRWPYYWAFEYRIVGRAAG